MYALWFDIYERMPLLVKHMRVEHNGGGCPAYLFSNFQLLSAVSDSSRASTSVHSTRNSLHYDTLHFILPTLIHITTLQYIIFHSAHLEPHYYITHYYITFYSTHLDPMHTSPCNSTLIQH